MVHPQSPERDIWNALKRLGHQVEYTSVRRDLKALDADLARFRPHVVFNMLEEFRDEGVFDFHVVSYLEALGVPYTGCNPRGMILSRNKMWVGEVARGLGVQVPRTQPLRPGQRVSSSIPLPSFLKFNREHASFAINQRNRVKTFAQLHTRVKEMRAALNAEILAQQFIEGREITVSIYGNRRLTALPPWELHLPKGEAFATERLKFSASYRRQHGIRARRSMHPAAARVVPLAKRLFEAMDLSGYARFDFRLRGDQPYLIDVNANPNLAKTEDMASAARAKGLTYPHLIQEILTLGRNYQPNR